MTTEIRTTIAPSDIIAVEIECENCHQRVARPVNQWLQEILSCPNCGVSWLAHRAELERVRDAVTHIRLLPGGAEMPFSVRFEIKRNSGDAA